MLQPESSLTRRVDVDGEAWQPHLPGFFVLLNCEDASYPAMVMSPEALSELIDEHSVHLRRWVAKKLFYYPQDVDDVLQHAFLKMVKAIDKISDNRVRARMSLWQAVRWSVQDYFRDRYGLPIPQELQAHHEAPAKIQHHLDSEENRRIMDIVNTLPAEKRRMILTLITEEGKPADVDRSTYHAHIHQARKILREKFRLAGIAVL